jgi:hypothetical protein
MEQKLLKHGFFEQYDTSDYLVIEKLAITDNLQKFYVIDIQPIFSDGVRGRTFTLRKEDIEGFINLLEEFVKE